MIRIIYDDGLQTGGGIIEDFVGMTFSGGEEHVNLKKQPITTLPLKIMAQITSSKEVMQLLLVTDALKRLYPNNDIELFMPYLPYARQDRVCFEGDAFSLEAFANLINLQRYSKVAVVDVHSVVAFSLFDNLIEIPQHSMVKHVAFRMRHKIDGFVAPDKGAVKKCIKWATEWDVITNNHSHLFTAFKKRDELGKIVSTELDTSGIDIRGMNLLIVDDICDGGRTFIELAKVLKKQGTNNIYLYVTHGIFSQGLPPLYDSGISQVYTTDSFPEKDDGSVVVKRFFY